MAKYRSGPALDRSLLCEKIPIYRTSTDGEILTTAIGPKVTA